MWRKKKIGKRGMEKREKEIAVVGERKGRGRSRGKWWRIVEGKGKG